jgi:hypothetical protein
MNSIVMTALLAALVVGFQDPPAPPATQAEDAKELLRKGLEAAASAGGFTFTGSVDQDSPFGGAAMGVGGPMLAVGPDGKCTGTLGADGMSHIRLEKEKNVYEIFRKGTKTVHRQVWKGTQIPSGSFAAEAAAALSLARVAKHAAKSKDVKKEEGTKKVGEVECVVYKAGLSPDLVDSDEESEPALGGMNFKMFELKKIEGRFYFGKDDNLLKKAEFKFVKGFNAMIAAAMPGGGGGDDEDEEEEDGGGMVKMSFASTFKFTLGEFSKTAAVTVPDDVKALLAE